MKVDELRSSGTVTGTTFSGNLSGGSVSATTGTFSGAVYYNEWLRNNRASASGLYWHNSSNPGWKWHIYPETQADMTFRTGSGNGGIKGTVENATARGYIHWTTSNEIGFLTSGRSWTLRCDNSKNVQIYGTVTAAKSEISKTALTQGASDYHLELYSGNTGDANKEISLRFHQANQYWYSMRARSGGFYFTQGDGNALVKIACGSLGVGTVTPSELLQVQDGHILMTGTWQSGSYYRLMGYNTAKQVQFSYNDGTWISDNNAILFGVGGTQASGTGVYTERMRITSGGNVGVNISNPTYKMHINGSIYYAGGGNYGSDDRIKYNEQNVSNALTLISQLQPQKYEKIVEVPRSAEGHWIPTDEEWENVKDEYEYDDEYGFIAQDVRNIPELSFLVTGEETRTDTKIITLEEYSNLSTEQQNTYSLSYVNDESAVITPSEYSNLTSEESNSYSVAYTKQFETETPLGLNYNGIFVLAVAAIQELNSQLQAEKSKTATLEAQVADLLARVTALENA